MFPVVTWKWGSLFSPEYVNRLRVMLARHLHIPHRLFCIADTPKGIGEGVTILPMYEDHADMKAGSRSCFRRLRMFDRGMGEILGPRFMHLDLDTVIVGDITHLAGRTEPLLIYDQNAGTGAKKPTYNPSVLIMNAGVRHDIWEGFHAAPQKVYETAKTAGFSCSDMAIIGYYLQTGLPAVTLGSKDGLVAYWRDVKPKNRIPNDARMILFYGNDNPGDPKVQTKNPWIKEHWGGEAVPAPPGPWPLTPCCQGKKIHRPDCTLTPGIPVLRVG